MKFGIFILQNQIPEWKDFYVDYNLLKTLLNPIKKNYKIHLLIEGDKKKIYNPQENSDLTKRLLEKDNIEPNELDYQKTFHDQIMMELKKVEYFFSQNLIFYKNRLRKINEQMTFIQKNKEFKEYKSNL